MFGRFSIALALMRISLNVCFISIPKKKKKKECIGFKNYIKEFFRRIEN